MFSRFKIVWLVISVTVILVIASPASAFVGPSDSAGSGGGLLQVDANNNIGFGTNNPTPEGEYDASSTESGSTSHGYVFMVASTTNPGTGIKNLTSGNTYLFTARNFGNFQLYRESTSLPGLVVLDINQFGNIGISVKPTSTSRLYVGGNIQSSGAFIGALSGNLSAANVTGPSAFGDNYGTYNFAFPGALAIGTSTTSGLPTQGLYVKGNVGIGTITPGSLLEVRGVQNSVLPLIVRGSAALSNQSLMAQFARGGSEKELYIGSIGAAYVYFSSTGGISLNPGVSGSDSAQGNAKFYLNASGYLGIGTSTPAYPLSVAGTIYSSTGGFRFPDGTTQITAYQGESQTINASYVSAGTFGSNSGFGNYSFTSTGGTPTLFVDNTTNRVGVGTTVANYKLDVQGGSVNATGGFCIAGDCKTAWNQVGGSAVGWSRTSPYVYLTTSSDYVGIGTASPGEKLSIVAGHIGLDYGYAIKGKNSAGNYQPMLYSGVMDSAADWAVLRSIGSGIKLAESGGSTVMTVTNLGKVGIGTTTPAYSLTVAGTIYSSTGGFRFPDNTTQITAYQGDTQTINASYVSAGTFGSNTGYGNFGFTSAAGTSTIYFDNTNARVGIGTTGPVGRLHATALTNEKLPSIFAGNNYTVDGSSKTFFPAGDAWYEYPSIVGVSPKTVTVDMASISNYGTVGVAGGAANLSGNRASVGVYGYSALEGVNGVSTGNQIFGTLGRASLTSAGTGFQGTMYGAYGKADLGAGSAGSSGANLYGGYFTAVGGTYASAYGGYFSASGGPSNYGVYSAGGTNYFADYVGIGTSTPNYKLSIVSPTNDVLRLGAPDPRITFVDGSANSWYLQAVNDSYLRVGTPTGGFNSVVITKSGKVGITTTTPAYPLTVAGTIYSSTGGFRFPDGTTQITAYEGATQTVNASYVSAGTFGSNSGYGNFGFTTAAGTSTLYVDNANARVGIGTATPSTKLDIVAGSVPGLLLTTNGGGAMQDALVIDRETNDLRGKFIFGNNKTDNTRGISFRVDSSAPRIFGGTDDFHISGDAGLVFHTNASSDLDTATERMRISTAGNVGIGTTTPYAYSKLDVRGEYSTDAFASQLHLHSTNNTIGMFLGSYSPSVGIISLGGHYYASGQWRAKYANVTGIRQYNGNIEFLADAGLALESTYTPTVRMSILSGGNVGIGTTTIPYPLTVNGIIYSASGGFRFPDGSTQTTAYQGATQTTNASYVSAGIFGSNTGYGNFGFVTATDTSTLYIDNTNARVGIGTASPAAYKLSVIGPTYIDHGQVAGWDRKITPEYIQFYPGGTNGIRFGGTDYGLVSYVANAYTEGSHSNGGMYLQGNVHGLTLYGRSNYGIVLVGKKDPTVGFLRIYNDTDTGAVATVSSAGGAYFAGSVGIATTTPAYPLTVAGTIYSSTGGFRFPDGSTQITAYEGATQTVNASYVSAGTFGSNSGYGNFGFTTAAGSSTLYVDNANARVGIGTANPGAKLHVADDGTTAFRIGNTQISTIGETNDVTYPGMMITPYNSTVHFGLSTNNTKIGIWHGASNYSYLQQNASDFRITTYTGAYPLLLQSTGGEVGIGTTDPNYKLDVQGGQVNASGGFCIAGVCKATWGEITGGAAEGWSRTGTNVHLTTSSDYVGIGTINPGTALQIYTPLSETVKTVLSLTNPLTTTSQNNGVAMVLGQSSSAYYSKIATVFENQNPSYLNPSLAFYTMNNTWAAGTEVERMRIKSNGYVGIGTTTPATALQVIGTATADSLVGILNASYVSGGTFGSNGGGGNFGFTSPAGTSTLYIDNTNARVGIGTTIPGAALEVQNYLAGEQMEVRNPASSPSYIAITNGETGAGISNGLTVGYNNGAMIVNRENSNLTLSTNDTARVIINGSGDVAVNSSQLFVKQSTGNVGIGTADPNTARLAVIGGNVGIGTTTPSRALELVISDGNGIKLGNRSVNGNLYVGRTDLSSSFGSYSAWINFGEEAVDGNNFVSFGTHEVGYTPPEKMRITGRGYVGIGTTTPSYKLDVQGGQMNASGGFCINGDCKTAWNQVGGSAVGWSRTGTYVHLTTSSDYVGIGVTNPVKKLHIEAVAGNADLMFSDGAGGTGNYRTTIDNTFTGSDAANSYMQFKISDGTVTGQATAMTLNGLGRIGIGTTTPAYPLTVAGTIYSSTGGFRFPDGSTQITAYEGATQTVNASYVSAGTFGSNSGYGNFGFTTAAGSSTLYVDNTNARVGVGTASPDSLLDIGTSASTPTTGTALHVQTAGDTSINVIAPSGSDTGIYFGEAGVSATQGGMFWDGGDDKLYFRSGDVIKVTIDNSGNVGVGTTGPNYKLDVQGGQVNASGGFCINGDCKTAWNQVGGSAVGWSRTGTNVHLSTSTDYVGIGTASPGAKTDIRTTRTSGTDAVALMLSDPVSGVQTGGYGNTIRWSSNGGASLAEIMMGAGANGTNNESEIRFRTQLGTGGGLQERVIITNTGKVGIGTTTPATALHVIGTVTASAFNGPMTGDLSAAYVSAGVFGSLSTKGNYTFQASTSTDPVLFVDAANKRVGVGTASPGYLLDINGNSMHRQVVYFSASSINYWDASGNIRNTGNLLVGGNVGIGTTNPAGPLNVVKAAGDNLIYADNYSTTGGNSNYWFSRRSHSNTAGTLATTLTGDALGTFFFQGVNASTAFAYGAKIIAQQNGTAGTYIPTDLSFSTYSATAQNSNQLVLSTNGYVGIGTTNPIGKTHIYSGASGQGTAYNLADELVIEHSDYAGISILTPNTRAGYLMFGDPESNARGFLSYDHVSDAMRFAVSGAEKVRINSSGYVGISTTTPAYPLTVAGTIYSSTGGFRFPDGSTQITAYEGSTQEVNASYISAGIFGSNSGYGNFGFTTAAGTSTLYVDNANARVGIGTASPSYSLSVNGTFQITGTNLLRMGNYSLAAAYWADTGATYGTHYFGPSSDVDIRIQNSLGYILLDNATGNVGIGTVNPLTKLHLNVGTNQNLQIGSASGVVQLKTTNDADTVYVPMQLRASAYYLLGGNVGIGTTTTTYPLTVAGTIYSSTGGFRFPDGSTQITAYEGSTQEVNASYISAGIFGSNSGYGNFGFTTAAGTSTIYFDNTNARVGIGTTGPITTLQINSENALLKFTNAASGGSVTDGLQFGHVGGGQVNSEMWNYENGYFRIGTNNTERLRILAGGNVGIGTTAPESVLHINSTSGIPVYIGDSTNVAHGMTDIVPTSVYGKFGKWSTSKGGFYFDGLSEDGTLGGLLFRGIAGATPTTLGAVTFRAAQKSGTGATNVDAVGLAFQFENYDMTKFLTILGNGYVGIGTTTPAQKLEVAEGRARIRETTANDYAVLEFGNDQDGLGGGFFLAGSAATGYGGARSMNLINIQAYPLALGTNNSVDMFINSAGSVGIGTTTPASALHVIGTVTASAFNGPMTGDLSAAYVSAGVFGSLSTKGNYTFQASTSTDPVLFVDAANKRVGIGTTAPSQKLELLLTTGGGISLGDRYTAGNFYIGREANSDFDSASGWINFGHQAVGGADTNFIGFSTWKAGVSGGERMRIDELGNVGIGTTTPAYKLDVVGTSRFTDTMNLSPSKWIVFGNSGPAGNPGGFQWTMTNDGASMYVSEVSADQTDYVFRIWDNTTNDRYVWWMDDYRGASYDKYPLVMAGNYANFFNGQLYLDNNSTSSLKIGMGTTAPTGFLNLVTEGGSGGSGSTRTMIRIEETSGTDSNWELGAINDFNDFEIWGGTEGSEASRLFINGSTGNIGIASSSAGYKLTVLGTGYFSQPVVVGYPTDSAHAATVSYVDSAIVAAVGGMTTTTGAYVLKTGDSMSGNLNMSGHNIIGVGKLTVQTIDPLYEIGGKKYATYVSDTIGLKVEAYGKAKLISAVNGEQRSYRYVIDFTKVERGSDLWLFWQTISEGENMKDVIVTLTPEFNGRTWYEMKPKEQQIIIYGEPSVSGQRSAVNYYASFHLVAPRHDAAQWGMESNSPEQGFKLEVR